MKDIQIELEFQEILFIDYPDLEIFHLYA